MADYALYEGEGTERDDAEEDIEKAIDAAAALVNQAMAKHTSLGARDTAAREEIVTDLIGRIG